MVEDAEHRGKVLKIKFSKTKIIPVHAGYDRLPATDLPAITAHKIITLVQVPKRGITGDLTMRGNALIIQQHIPPLILVEQEMQLPTRIHQLVRDQVFRLIVELALGYHIAPFHIAILIEGDHEDVLRMVTVG